MGQKGVRVRNVEVQAGEKKGLNQLPPYLPYWQQGIVGEKG